MQAEADALRANGQLLEQRGAPYERLFPLVDLNVIHGGLGRYDLEFPGNNIDLELEYGGAASQTLLGGTAELCAAVPK